MKESEAEYMEDGADYLEEGCQRQTCDGCMAYNYCLIKEQDIESTVILFATMQIIRYCTISAIQKVARKVIKRKTKTEKKLKNTKQNAM